MRPILYIAGDMFCGAKRDYNQHLTHRLEELGYKVILPQRDGFDFTRLHRGLSGFLPEHLAVPACHLFIYLLDLGIFVENADVVVANTDEPIDPGMHREMLYAQDVKKYAIAVRTDERSPFGDYKEPLGGMHSFVWFSATHWMRVDGVMDSSLLRVPFYERVAHRIDSILQKRTHDSKKHRIIRSGISRDIRRRAEYLFDGISNHNDQKSLETLVERYQKRLDWLTKIQPHEA